MTANHTAQGEEPITWKGWVTLSLVACVFSAALGAWRPIWIAPPLFQYTAILYVALTWVGTVIIIVARRYRPNGGKAWPILGTLVNVVFSVVASALIVIAVFFAFKGCTKVSTESVIVRYHCTWSFFWQGYGITLDGLPYFPLMLQTGSSSSRSSFG